MKSTLLLLSLGLTLLAQDAGLVLRTSVSYRTQRASRPLTDEQKKEADRLEAVAREANQSRNYGEALRNLYHALAVVNNVPWTPTLEAASGLQAKADHAVPAPAATVRIRIASLFPADRAAEPLTASLVLRPAKGEQEQVLLAPAKLATLPAELSAKLPQDTAGDYIIETRLAAPTPLDPKAKAYMVKVTPVHIEDFSTDIVRLRASLQKAPRQSPALATAEYALSQHERADQGDINPHRVDFRKEFAAAQSVADSLAAGADPFAGRKGDFHRAYRSAVDRELQPYRLFIPGQYDGSTPAPLVVALHGMGGDENSMFDGYGEGLLKREAARVGFIVACPKGRDAASMYQGTAETDVLDVLAEVRRAYKIDANRIYLMGHSMGGYGTWAIAMKHPEIWAALGPISGGGNPGGMAAIKHIPEYVVHGDNDKTVPVTMSRNMVEAGRKLGATIQYVEVPGGSHTDIAVPNFAPMFDFFAKQKKAEAAAGTR